MKQRKTMLRGAASWLAASVFMRRGRSLWERNKLDWELPLSRPDKIRTGLYIILRDYADGRFPPRFEDREEVYEKEIASRHLPGRSETGAMQSLLRKPFWSPASIRLYLRGHMETVRILDACGLQPGSRLLEIGCSGGWMAEWLAIQGFDVLATTLSEHDVTCARRRIRSLEEKGLTCRLRFIPSPMEKVHEQTAGEEPFDAVFVYEALHHAFDWQETVRSVHACLRPGAWFLILHEPNLLHTLVSYRIGRLKNTHEIGFSRPHLIHYLKQNGFAEIRIMKHRINTPLTPIWLAARKTASRASC